uniref:Uncharacterized protein n=1 Tax=Anguilla anguilla TaxID=7936 RepID=A0A0E9R1G7_ANGAN
MKGGSEVWFACGAYTGSG